MNIVFATAEVSPLAKTGGLGDVCGSLPKALAKLGHHVTIFMPFYRQARHWLERTNATVHQVLPTTTIAWANWAAEATYLRTTLPGTDITIILVANDVFFEREQIYGPSDFDVDDSLLRYIFFCRAVIRGCELLDLSPDILHCHDWHTALIPAYLHSGLRAGEPHFARTRSVFTIHNLHYQGVAGYDAFAMTGLHSRYWAADALEHFGTLNPMKGGILFADQVTTVSPTYSFETRTPEHGAGLDGVLRGIAHKYHGLLNGIDVEEWDPATDPLIKTNYDAETLRDKQKNKRALAKEAGLNFSAKTPIIGAVSRLVGQKGFQLLIPILERILHAGAQVVILGSGETELEEALTRIAAQHPQCRVWLGFDNALAHRIYAGSDIMMMPSMYEPCGLNQMYALRYGTIPVVRLTGGLADTVIPFDGSNGDVANGFGFVAAHPVELYLATWVAMLNYKDAAAWHSLQSNGMRTDFSWERSAQEYDRVYKLAALLH